MLHPLPCDTPSLYYNPLLKAWLAYGETEAVKVVPYRCMRIHMQHVPVPRVHAMCVLRAWAVDRCCIHPLCVHVPGDNGGGARGGQLTHTLPPPLPLPRLPWWRCTRRTGSMRGVLSSSVAARS